MRRRVSFDAKCFSVCVCVVDALCWSYYLCVNIFLESHVLIDVSLTMTGPGCFFSEYRFPMISRTSICCHVCFYPGSGRTSCCAGQEMAIGFEIERHELCPQHFRERFRRGREATSTDEASGQLGPSRGRNDFSFRPTTAPPLTFY